MHWSGMMTKPNQVCCLISIQLCLIARGLVVSVLVKYRECGPKWPLWLCEKWKMTRECVRETTSSRVYSLFESDSPILYFRNLELLSVISEQRKNNFWIGFTNPLVSTSIWGPLGSVFSLLLFKLFHSSKSRSKLVIESSEPALLPHERMSFRHCPDLWCWSRPLVLQSRVSI